MRGKTIAAFAVPPPQLAVKSTVYFPNRWPPTGGGGCQWREGIRCTLTDKDQQLCTVTHAAGDRDSLLPLLSGSGRGHVVRLPCIAGERAHHVTVGTSVMTSMFIL